MNTFDITCKIFSAGGRNSPALSAEVGYHKPHLVLSYDATRRQSIKDSSGNL